MRKQYRATGRAAKRIKGINMRLGKRSTSKLVGSESNGEAATVEKSRGMKLVNAKLYEEQIKRKMWEIWYEEKYQYYFVGGWRRDFSLSENSNEYQRMAFAVLNDSDDLIGFIQYYIDPELRIAQWFAAINFSEDKITFSRALRKVIEDCFLRFNMRVVEWNVVCGNPVERGYDRMCKKLGGRIVGIKRNRSVDLAGNVHDNKEYEILREDFLKATNKVRCGKQGTNERGKDDA